VSAERRYQDLHALMMEHTALDPAEIEQAVAALYCNGEGCDRVIVADNPATVLQMARAEGWKLGTALGDDDLCGRCTA
jgi:hypothetical protein